MGFSRYGSTFHYFSVVFLGLVPRKKEHTGNIRTVCSFFFLGRPRFSAAVVPTCSVTVHFAFLVSIHLSTFGFERVSIVSGPETTWISIGSEPHPMEFGTR